MGRSRLAVYAGVCAVALAVLLGGYLLGGAARDVTRFVVVLAPLAAALLDRWLGRRDPGRG